MPPKKTATALAIMASHGKEDSVKINLLKYQYDLR
jgi:hypothetical protein